MLGFKKMTWNFSEASHGKGAPDGVGGAVKRLADEHVKKGGDIQKPEDLCQLLQSTASNIRYFWVSDKSDVSRYDESVPDNLMKQHVNVDHRWTSNLESQLRCLRMLRMTT